MITNKELCSSQNDEHKSNNLKINSIGLFGRKKYEEVKEELRENSEFGNLKNWDIISVIVKSGESIEQEKFASLLMHIFKETFEKHKVK